MRRMQMCAFCFNYSSVGRACTPECTKTCSAWQLMLTQSDDGEKRNDCTYNNNKIMMWRTSFSGWACVQADQFKDLDNLTTLSPPYSSVTKNWWIGQESKNKAYRTFSFASVHIVRTIYYVFIFPSIFLHMYYQSTKIRWSQRKSPII